MMKRIVPHTATLLAGILIGAVLVLGCGLSSNPKKEVGGAPPSAALGAVNASQVVSEARNTPIVRAAQSVGPAVVGITNKAFARDGFNRLVLVEKGTGSGVLFDEKGYVATNFHVVADAQELIVSLSDGRSFKGRVLGVDAATDLAVVKIDGDKLPVARFGDSDGILVGEPAIAIGNPLGLEFRGSVTAGVISALNRSIDVGDRRFKLIQTDAAINPGNSGGALVNADGLVIGINSAKVAAGGVEGIGFAIPVNAAKPILQSIIEKGRVVRAYLGVGLIDQQMAARYGYDLQLENGVYVAKLFNGGPAAKAGLIVGDIILSINGTSVKSVADLRAVLDNLDIGQKVQMDINRDGNISTVTVVLEEMPSQE